MPQLIGVARLGRDAEVRHTPNGDTVTNLSLAFNYGRKGDDGKRPTQWVDAALWGQRAEKLAEWLVKGQQVYVVVDDVHIETYDLRDGGQGSKLAGNIQTIEFAGSPPQSAGGDGAQRQAAPSRAPAPARAPARSPAPAPARSGWASTGFADMDDDVPFISGVFELDMSSKLDRRVARIKAV